MDKELKNKAKLIHKQSMSKSLMTGFSFGAVAVLILLFSLIHPALELVLIPFVLIPIYYAMTLIHLSFSYENNLNLSSIFQYFKMYFKRPNFGVFNIISNLIRSIGVGLLGSVVFGIVAIIVTSSIYGDAFYNVIQTLMEASMSAQEVDLVVLLGDNYKILYLYEIISTLPATVLSNAAFIYFINRSSLGIYLRLSYPKSDPNFLRQTFAYASKKYSKELRKDYWSLNWPFYLLLIIGMALGAFLGIYLYSNIELASALSLVGGALFVTPFLPFYFSNKEALYSKYEQNFINCSIEVTNAVIKNLQSRIELNEEEKKDLERMLNNLENPLEEHEENEDNKSE